MVTILDLFSRKIIGWETGISQTSDLIITVLSKAVSRISNNELEITLHSNQGSQYILYDYVIYTRKYNITLK